MSYTRSFSKVITIHYSGTVSYPPSQNGGTKSFSGSVSETVNVNVHVDTNPFDNSISHCNSQVNLLTGAVVATEAAQVKSIDSNSRQVANTIVSGFFKTISSEISQQISELRNNIDATLLHLVGLSKRCLEKKEQMGVDYERICQRYIKIFDQLDSELKNRIHEIDRPAFKFRSSSDQYAQLAADTDMVSTVAVTGTEEARLQAQLGAASIKRRAFNALSQANLYLQKQQEMRAIIKSQMHDGTEEATYYVPLLFTTTCDSRGVESSTLHTPGPLKRAIGAHQQTAHRIEQCRWRPMGEEEREQVARYFNAHVGQLAGTTPHEDRVRDLVLKLFTNNNIQKI